MMRNWSSFVAKNCRNGRSSGFAQSRRGITSSAAPEDPPTPVFLMASLTGFFGYIINDLVNAERNRKSLRKTKEEASHLRKLYREKEEQYAKRIDEISKYEW